MTDSRRQIQEHITGLCRRSYDQGVKDTFDVIIEGLEELEPKMPALLEFIKELKSISDLARKQAAASIIHKEGNA